MPPSAPRCRTSQRTWFRGGLEWRRYLAEVYPHPALVRWFELRERIRYKKGRVAERRRAFRGLQRRLLGFRAAAFPELDTGPAVLALLDTPWTKDVEDQTDAFLCALIGLWHHRENGRRTDIFGDTRFGFMLVPSLDCATLHSTTPGP